MSNAKPTGDESWSSSPGSLEPIESLIRASLSRGRSSSISQRYPKENDIWRSSDGLLLPTTTTTRRYCERERERERDASSERWKASKQVPCVSRCFSSRVPATHSISCCAWVESQHTHTHTHTHTHVHSRDIHSTTLIVPNRESHRERERERD